MLTKSLLCVVLCIVRCIGLWWWQFPSALDYNKKGASKDFDWPSFKPNRTVINAFRGGECATAVLFSAFRSLTKRVAVTGHWFSYVFLVDKFDQSAKTVLPKTINRHTSMGVLYELAC